jgi:hypothetical protein
MMPVMQFSEQWETFRPRLYGLRTWLGTPERTNTLLRLLWPLVALVIGILIIGRASTAKELSDLISAFASLIWALVPIAILISFSQEIRVILSRIRKGKFLGQEIELEELHEKTVAAEVRAELPMISGEVPASLGELRLEASGKVGVDTAQDAVQEVLRQASGSPRLALMLLSTRMDGVIRDRAAETGLVSVHGAKLRTVAIRGLVQAEEISPEDADAINLFYEVRNRVLHGQNARDDQVASAVDSGTRLLRLLLSRPRPSQENTTPADGG